MKERLSNFELLRIIAMLMVVWVHCNYYSLGAISQENVVSSPGNSFIRILFEQLCVIGVNVFVLISGWFWIKPSIKGITSLLFQVCFYGILILGIGMAWGLSIPVVPSLKVFIFGAAYWFIPSYLLLYILSPLLNSFIETSSRTQLLYTLLSLFLLEFSLGWLIDTNNYAHGYTAICFIGLYLLARYIRKYSKFLVNFSAISDFSIYLLLTIIPSLIAFIGLKHLGITFGAIHYCSPFVVGASVFFLLMFNRIKIKSLTINQLGGGIFSVYLIHQHPILIPYYKEFLAKLYAQISGWQYVVSIIVGTIILSICCVLVDKLRQWMWRFVCKSHIFEKLETSNC